MQLAQKVREYSANLQQKNSAAQAQETTDTQEEQKVTDDGFVLVDGTKVKPPKQRKMLQMLIGGGKKAQPDKLNEGGQHEEFEPI